MEIMNKFLEEGVWFQSAVSGLYYAEHKGVGDIMCVIINGVHYYPKFSGKEQAVKADAEIEAGVSFIMDTSLGGE
jgi:hypothetical protein